MPDTVDSNGMAAAINSAKANFESDTGNSFKAFRRLLENDEFSTKSGFTTKAQEENQQFFEYLASNFEYKSGTEEEEKAKPAMEERKLLSTRARSLRRRKKPRTTRHFRETFHRTFLTQW